MLRSKRVRVFVVLTMLSAGTLFQAGATGCAQMYFTEALSAFDFCTVFNCESGSYFNLCEPFPLLMDCPSIRGATSP